MSGWTWKEWFGMPALVVGALIAIGALFKWLGIDFTTAPIKLERHIVAESTYHEKQQPKFVELDQHAEEQERLLESLIRGECLENSRSALSRQGLIRKCRELGINP